MRLVVLLGILAGLGTVPTFAHEVTYKGTVAAVEVNRFAAADGVLGTIDVKLDGRTRPMTFDITHHTQIWRGSNRATFATAAIQKGEAVTLTFSDEEAEKGALEIRLPLGGK